MKTLKLLGVCAFQADIKPKGSRTFRRSDMATLVEYEIPSITAADLVRDAVVVMPVDDRHFYNHRQNGPVRTSYAGWESALWRPMTTPGGSSVPVDVYAATIRLAPHYHNRIRRDPLMEARILPASPIDHGSSIEEKHIQDADKFVGTMEWTNKADAVAQHHAASKLLLVVDGEVWLRHPGPTWQVQQSNGHNAKFGTVLLEPDIALYPAHDPFRLDRLQQASELCAARWGRAEVHGAIERMDARFIARDDLSCVFHTHLDPLIRKGDGFLAYLRPEAVQAFCDLHRLLSVKSPLTPYASADIDFVTERMAILKEAISDRSLPHRLLQISKDVVTNFRLVEERIRLERSAIQAMPSVNDPADEEAIASLGVRP
jgi:hypothetical protein